MTIDYSLQKNKYGLHNVDYSICRMREFESYLKKYHDIYHTAFSKANFINSMYHSSGKCKIVEEDDHYDVYCLDAQFDGRCKGHYFIDKQTAYIKLDDNFQVYCVYDYSDSINLTSNQVLEIISEDEPKEQYALGLTKEAYQEYLKEIYLKVHDFSSIKENLKKKKESSKAEMEM